MNAKVRLWDEEDERRHRAFQEWATSPRPPIQETYPLHQMGADGKRKARYRKGDSHEKTS